MPKDNSVRAALELIAANLIKERQEGLDLLTEICSNPANCQQLQATPGGLGWLQVYQSLFKLVRLEQRAALDTAKAGKTRQINRLSQTSNRQLLIGTSFKSVCLKISSSGRESQMAGGGLKCISYKQAIGRAVLASHSDHGLEWVSSQACCSGLRQGA
jgi:hypothetical protein